MVQILPVEEDSNRDNYKSVGNFTPEIIVNFFRPKVGPNMLPMSRVCRNRSL